MRPLVLRTVLAATDLDEPSLASVRAAADLARLAGARLHVVYAVDAPDAEAGRSLAVALRDAGVNPATLASTHVERGPADRAIVERAVRVGADAIVLGPHSPHPDPSGSLGSTADRVVRTARVPCLVLPSPLPLPLGRVLAPVDLSTAGYGSLLVALTWTSALRRRTADPEERTELCVLHVAEEGGAPEAAREALHREVEEVCTRAAGFAGVRMREMVESGDPAEEILRYATGDGTDLLVMGTRGDERELLGSVSSAVARRAAGPVLLVPPAVWREHGSDPLLPRRKERDAAGR